MTGSDSEIRTCRGCGSSFRANVDSKQVYCLGRSIEPEEVIDGSSPPPLYSAGDLVRAGSGRTFLVLDPAYDAWGHVRVFRPGSAITGLHPENIVPVERTAPQTCEGCGRYMVRKEPSIHCPKCGWVP